MSAILSYKTIAHASTAEYKDRGSRFLAYAFPVNDTGSIREHLQHLKEEHPKAVHHCYAWRLGTDGNQFRVNDDGEPSGSAAKPILSQIDSFQLTQLLIVVVRYFGGTLLGVPGLIQAYKTASRLALEQVPLIEKDVEKDIHIRFPYSLMNEIMRVLKQHKVTVL
ncbi:MAG TPA: YigZ family protein, partial [Chitinophagaceae bacterium]|nr:YigZ family protein [Chitinophagaceae bacterium]